ncbi:hypothetical protein SPI_07801 [Niveomyces insectorum RCEF 264]|uniref:Uncharacterized protein n=1 Tax=Niveomyces insectorum RCEF 264 TaxID=1081102 RepID=A0A167P1K0_9HYPO|nr:hypothetical protein SPI_07801 [Niveomyces insectorum RCEF 264]
MPGKRARTARTTAHSTAPETKKPVGATATVGEPNLKDAETTEHFDEASLDEEEVPGASDDLLSTGSEEDKSNRRSAYYEGGYNALKSFNGQVYSGMAVGGSHTWNYDPGVWKETKKEPDLWEIDFKTTKRRARTAPRGSGAPVGTEYHWLIVAHQYVTKTDANTYETHMTGSKYKLAHKVASSHTWSVPTVKGQRAREVELLEDAKRRVEKLPPVLASERVKTNRTEKGQQKLDALFAKAAGVDDADSHEGKKRKRDVNDEHIVS